MLVTGLASAEARMCGVGEMGVDRNRLLEGGLMSLASVVDVAESSASIGFRFVGPRVVRLLLGWGVGSLSPFDSSSRSRSRCWAAWIEPFCHEEEAAPLVGASFVCPRSRLGVG